jgi:hypothetical protein
MILMGREAAQGNQVKSEARAPSEKRASHLYLKRLQNNLQEVCVKRNLGTKTYF